VIQVYAAPPKGAAAAMPEGAPLQNLIGFVKVVAQGGAVIKYQYLLNVLNDTYDHR
jgi:hypothetical protein